MNEYNVPVRWSYRRLQIDTRILTKYPNLSLHYRPTINSPASIVIIKIIPSLSKSAKPEMYYRLQRHTSHHQNDPKLGGGRSFHLPRADVIEDSDLSVSTQLRTVTYMRKRT